MGLDRLCGAVLCVRAPWWVRLERARRRDGLSLLQGLRRIASQRGIYPKLPGPGVDIYYVDNSGDETALRERVLRLLREKRLGN
jgi:dephospho-CoA kinase